MFLFSALQGFEAGIKRGRYGIRPEAYSRSCQRSPQTSMCNNDVVRWMIMTHQLLGFLLVTGTEIFTLTRLEDRSAIYYSYPILILLTETKYSCFSAVLMHESIRLKSFSKKIVSGTGGHQYMPKFELWTLISHVCYALSMRMTSQVWWKRLYSRLNPGNRDHQWNPDGKRYNH